MQLLHDRLCDLEAQRAQVEFILNISTLAPLHLTLPSPSSTLALPPDPPTPSSSSFLLPFIRRST